MARSLRLSLVLLISLSLLAPGIRAADEDGGASAGEERAERIVLRLVNKYRTSRSLPALTLNPVIRREARRHARRLAILGDLSHQGLDERKQTIAEADSGTDEDKICENTAKAQGIDAPGSAGRAIVRGWKNGPRELRRCMADRPFTKQSAGVGARQVGRDWYVVFIAANDTTP